MSFLTCRRLAGADFDLKPIRKAAKILLDALNQLPE
jgi:hypothetical protein